MLNEKLLAAIALLTLTAHTIDALHCLSCTATISPRHCHTLQKCEDGKVCFTQRYAGINGEVLFDTGCHTPSICQERGLQNSVKSRSHNPAYPHTEQCVECCSSDACNHKGCGSPDFPTRRGPLCFNCPQSLDPSLCSSVRVCDENEICHLHEEVEFGESIFVQSCSQRHICDSGSPNIFGKRSIERCLKCCDSDLCNGDCAALTTTTTTSTTTTTIPTTTLPYSFPFDCWEVLHNGFNNTGIYQIYPWGSSKKSVDVLCNMDVEPKGWTVFQWRHPLTENFHRNWEEYKNGFGNVSGEFWLGNEVVHLLSTAHPTQFYIGISSTSGESWYEKFDNTKVDSESNKYRITLGQASGTAGDQSTPADNAGSMTSCYFTTYDRDNDRNSRYNCAAHYRGGWWFNNCDYVFLNAPRGYTGDNVYRGRINMNTFNSSILMITRM